jgi:hypothetical protein
LSGPTRFERLQFELFIEWFNLVLGTEAQPEQVNSTKEIAAKMYFDFSIVTDTNV